MKLGIVIPCFNESQNIPSLIQECNQILKYHECEFLILDNGSMDDTWSILNSHKNNDAIKISRIEKNLGYGYGIRKGLQLLDSEYVGWIHGDLQTELEVLRVVIPRLKPSHFFKGMRKNRNPLEKAISISMAWLVSSLLQEKMKDINAQPMIFHRRHLDILVSSPNDFNFDLYIYYSLIKKGIQEERIKTKFNRRRHGKSSWNYGLLSKYEMSKKVLAYAKDLRSKSDNSQPQG